MLTNWLGQQTRSQHHFMNESEMPGGAFWASGEKETLSTPLPRFHYSAMNIKIKPSILSARQLSFPLQSSSPSGQTLSQFCEWTLVLPWRVVGLRMRSRPGPRWSQPLDYDWESLGWRKLLTDTRGTPWTLSTTLNPTFQQRSPRKKHIISNIITYHRSTNYVNQQEKWVSKGKTFHT